MNPSQVNWAVLLAKLKKGSIPDEEIGSAIVNLAKPLDPDRIFAAEETVLSYLNHRNSWVRHEVLWFIQWAELTKHKPTLIRSLREDPDPDNRGFAALCLAHLLRNTSDKDSVQALKTKVLDENEKSAVRLNSYGALLEIVSDTTGFNFFSGSANLENVNWEWVQLLGRVGQS